MIFLSTSELKEILSGRNKSFVTRVSNQQEKKYGNKNIIEAVVNEEGINMFIGERNIHFYFSADGQITDIYGNSQGGKHAAQLEYCAVELFHKLIMKGE